MTQSARFWDKIATRYAASPIKNVDNYNRTMERTRAHLSADDRVLEVGCGTGSTALLLSEHVAHVTASDVSGAMIEIANAKAREAEAGNVTFMRAELFDHAPGAGTFDAVLAFNFLHLVPDTEAAVRHIATLVKPGGVFISKTVCLGRKRWVLGPIVGAMRLIGKAPYVNFVNAAKLEAEIAEAGFEIVESTTFDGAPDSRFIVARKT